MLVQVVFKLLELLVGDHKGGTGIAGNGIVPGEMTDGMDRLADLLMFTIQFRQGCPNRLLILCFRLSAGGSRCFRPLDGRKENYLFPLEMGRHVGRNFCKERVYLDHFRMVDAVHGGNLPVRVSDCLVIFGGIPMVRSDNVVGERRE